MGVAVWVCPNFLERGPWMENVLQDRPTNDKRRSERVKLTVPVLVTTATVDGREVQELTQTAIVNAHGEIGRASCRERG